MQGLHPQQFLSEVELGEIEIIYRFDHTYSTIRGSRIIVKMMKFKKWDPKLKAIASAKKK